MWIHIPHYTHKIELAFTLKLQTQHGSTLLLNKPSFVMPQLIITPVFPRLTFKPLLSKASFHFKNSFLSPSIVSLIRTKSTAYSNCHNTPTPATSAITSTTTIKRKSNSTDLCYIHTLTSKSSLTFVFAPSYKLITHPTKTSGIPFFHIAHTNTFLGTLSKAFSRSTKHICKFFPS